MSENREMRGRPEDLRKHEVVIGSYFSLEMLAFVAVQTPMFLLYYVPRTINTLFRTLFVDKPPTDADVVRYVINTPLGMLAKECDGKKGCYKIDIRSCHIELKSLFFKCVPDHISSWGMEFSLNEDVAESDAGIVLHKFTLNGENLTSTGAMLTVLFFYHTNIHTKQHTLFKALKEYIVENKIDELRPSTYITGALHTILMNCIVSPIDKYSQFVPFLAIFHVPITKESIRREGVRWDDFVHAGAYRLRHSKFTNYYKFLWAAREICLDELSKIGVGMPYAEFIFITTVVHSTDHYQISKMIKGLRSSNSIAARETLFGEFVSASTLKGFLDHFTASTTNPLFTNRMCFQKKGTVYRNIYERMAMVDKELADVVTCSMMY